jgi:hypothetical protein
MVSDKSVFNNDRCAATTTGQRFSVLMIGDEIKCEPNDSPLIFLDISSHHVFHVRFIASRILKPPANIMDQDESIAEVEWLYAFDVHTNAFLPLVIFVYGIQLILFPWMIGKGWFIRILSNSFYTIVYIYYCYMTFLGFAVLPFLQDTVVFLVYPVGFILCTYVLSLLTGNWARLVYSYYF